MADVQIFDAGREGKSWVSYFADCRGLPSDIYQMPEFGLLYCSLGSEYKLFTYKEHDAVWAYSFLLQALPVDYRDIAGNEARDIETPYGYGGPVTNTEDEAFIGRANDAFQEWCLGVGVIAEFVRFHPVLCNQNARSPYITPIPNRLTVSLSLSQDKSILSAFDGNARNMVKRFKREGATIEETEFAEDFEQFVEIYKHTMRRVSADDFYYFDLGHFDRLRRLTLGPAKLYVVKRDGKIAAGAIFLMGSDILHYHLSATDSDNNVAGATNALIAKAAEQGRQHGFKRLHFGGGQSNLPNDRLLKFKRRMSTDEHSFWIGKYVHDEKVYSDLCGRWRDQNPDSVAEFGNRILCYRFASSS